MTIKTILLIAGLLILQGCSQKKPNEDPLKNTKKLFVEGHTSLYENGAFQVPNTTFKFIPAGTDTKRLAKDLIFVNAKDSFTISLQDAKNALGISVEGTKYSVELAKKVYKSSDKLAGKITSKSRSTGVGLLKKSVDTVSSNVGGSIDFAKTHTKSLSDGSTQFKKNMYKGGDNIKTKSSIVGQEMVDVSGEFSSVINKKVSKNVDKHYKYTKDVFVQGYVQLPTQLSKRVDDASQSMKPENFKKAYNDADKFRARNSLVFSKLVTDTFDNYGKNVGKSFDNAQKSFNNYENDGVVLASLKAMKWVLKGIFYDGIVEPAWKLSVGAIGYISVNGVIFPVMVVVNEGVAVTKVAVKVTYNSALAVYDIVAPTGTAALAGVLTTAELVAGKTVAGGVYVTGAVVGKTTQAVGYGTSLVMKSASEVVDASVQYIGVPIAATGLAVGKTTYGVVAGTAQAGLGSVVTVTGEVAGATTQGFGVVLAGTTAVGGTAVSIGTAAVAATYNSAKAVVVPTSYTLSSGVVLGYGTVAQMGAQSVLLASDAAYLVLSLEGPRWVIYAVQGDLEESKKVPVGAVVDLEKMKQSGETIKYIPVNKDEMKKVVDHMGGEK